MSKYLDVVRLKADGEETMLSALKEALETNENDDLVISNHTYFVDVFGDLYAETGNTLTDEDGNEYPEKELLDGYHANLKTKDQSQIDALSDLIIEVDNPLRKIAGK